MSSDVEAVARAWMYHQGYSKDEVDIAEQATHQQYGCEYQSQGYDCTDENGNSRHPIWDALYEASEMANVAIEALAERVDR